MTDRVTEYIGQLEGEIAAKAAEADELRAKNQELMSENTRLTDLTRMLLASEAFSSFLNELSGTGGQVGTTSAPSEEQAPVPKVEEPQREPPKDINPHQPSSHMQPSQTDAQVGMTPMPETYTSFSTMNTAWADNMDSGLYDAQVYAVTSMPEGPTLDQLTTDVLSGKSLSFSASFLDGDAKQTAPAIENPPLRFGAAQSQLSTIEDLTPVDREPNVFDPSFALYDDEPPSTESSDSQPENIIFGSIQPEKALDRIELNIVDEGIGGGNVSAATMEKFLRFCAIMEGHSKRVASLTSHLL